MVEENLRRSLQVSDGDPTVFFTRPLSLLFILATVLILIVMVMPAVRKRRDDIAG
jgi:TctA family transporter